MHRFKNILAAVDSESGNEVPIKLAAQFAKRNGGKLKLVDVVEELGWLKRIATPRHAEFEEHHRQKKAHELEIESEWLQREGVDVSTKVLLGKPAVEIVREVLRDAHDLLIRHASGSSASGSFFGTTGMTLLRKCPCPVWLIQPEVDHEDRRVLAAVDATCHDDEHDELNRKILDLATSFSEIEKCRFDVVQAWSIFGEVLLQDHMQPHEFQDLVKESLANTEECLDRLIEPYGLNHDSDNVYLLHGEPGLVIPQFVEEQKTDLIVMGTIGRAGLSGILMGNTAETILRKVECSVLAVKPDGFMSPITLES